ncbi:hypothetical protein [Fodinibius sp. SL11]|uniref:hypothetical protein n=1 Tax=Fodinibius sp. SL11 TaxID=3425690 RepID=UPI003F882C01
MSIGDKELYKCDQCYRSLVAIQRDEGTVPMLFDCLSTSCNWILSRKTDAVNTKGKKPTYELVENPDIVTDKLKVQRIEEADHASD